ncbi:hypothetical protein KBY24_15485 [Ruegeria pomeroyi]|uniref:Uncharacterized protein n=2 Tax=Ruegeria TaxID=97050 RepID=A0A9Q3WI27_9RHOB|nr:MULTISPECIES: hypothetical protein [Ruegeria]MCE8510639.1 hypothetical protein [Ruegeria pomeroyi]MCE8513248.1 hypothetical protein [Ruegeria pomeroyi]MCE8517766.1 hypothetical protein [Ruegeria pomeroyi]MCE8522465.1 hypothetical protein [Ruegeria pomeroyi]MCE8526823.1 hypothetical protein [Ruegeria pomeroyi]
MSLRQTHELHQRRFGRNLGVALTLAAFIVIIFGLTVVKVTRGDFEPPQASTGGQG